VLKELSANLESRFEFEIWNLESEIPYQSAIAGNLEFGI
jgi:hypothetical protein